MFGLQWFDVEMQDLLQRHGLTVSEAVELRKRAALPDSLETAWRRYEKLLDEHRASLDGWLIARSTPARQSQQ
ncbi:hypothetical protein [Paraburkholderia fungorum]|uniref:hypothetical protein n=1 Tax=Paraburkholderia fungorum TaxID=134537 RepID=UPI0016074BF4|nr:hypothetical protein [Paraburkholderia fungorum]MBB5547558.1 hypothetical protein [Paraburkholderia fungorum]